MPPRFQPLDRDDRETVAGADRWDRQRTQHGLQVRTRQLDASPFCCELEDELLVEVPSDESAICDVSGDGDATLAIGGR